MAKRANPYSEDFITRSKTFVGVKQYNQRENRMKEIYERTLQILFQGARRPLPYPSNTVRNGVEYNDTHSNKLKQLSINNNGTLGKNAYLTVERLQSLNTPCKCGDQTFTNCAYCEASLCSNCMKFCEDCSGSFCTLCCVDKFDNQEVATCISCYK